MPRPLPTNWVANKRLQTQEQVRFSTGLFFLSVDEMRRFCVVCLSVLLLLSACGGGERRPDGVLAPEAMAALLAEAYLLEGFYAIETQYRYDTVLPEVLRAYDTILSRHGTTREAVERSFDYYAKHPELYQPIQDSVMALLDRTADADSVAVDRELPRF